MQLMKEAAAPAAIKLAIARLKPVLERASAPLKWEDVQPAIERIDTGGNTSSHEGSRDIPCAALSV